MSVCVTLRHHKARAHEAGAWSVHDGRMWRERAGSSSFHDNFMAPQCLTRPAFINVNH